MAGLDLRNQAQVRVLLCAVLAVGVLAISLVLFLFRRIVQDGERPHWREFTPSVPGEEPAPSGPAWTSATPLNCAASATASSLAFVNLTTRVPRCGASS